MGRWARSLLQRALYTRVSLAPIPAWSGYRAPESCLYFNAFGRFLFGLQQRWYLLWGVRQRLAIRLEHFDDIDYGRLYRKGNPQQQWPPPPFVETAKNGHADAGALIGRLEASYALACRHDPQRLPLGPWWKDRAAEFQASFFDDRQAIKRDVLQNFRRLATSQAAIIADQLDTVVPQESFAASYKRAVQLVQQYHQRSAWVDHAILGSVSESFSGNNLCPVYRGQRLSRRLLLHAYYVSQIRRHARFGAHDAFSILDLGGAYGGLIRLLSLYYTNCRAFLIELPEVCVLAGYFLSEALPDRRVRVLADMNLDDLRAGKIEGSARDVYVLPTWAVEYLPDRSIDLVINTQSLGEMSKEAGQYYIRHIERLASGYFYSSNRPFSDMAKYDDFGFYNWGFQERWHTVLCQMNHLGKLEWLGHRES
jgi:putative sugar O-methyltransferase